MKILIVNTSERTGGAAVAANRLMKALNNSGVKAKMLVRDKESDTLTVAQLPKSPMKRWHFLWERLVVFFHLHFSKQHLFEIDIANAGTDITNMREFQEADIIHLHWINQGMLSLNSIRKILRSGKPVVWTMHDIWPATGICHYTRGCGYFKTACKQCQLLPGGGSANDLSTAIWNQKQKLLSEHHLSFVACSKWLEGEAKKSALLQGQHICSVPNPIDTHIYHPEDKLQARQRLELPTDKRIILFVSQRVTDDRKGMAYFTDAINRLAEQHPEARENTVIAILGGHAEDVAPQLALPVYPLGYVNDEKRIVDVYNAADVFVLPSLEDNLPNTIMEAMACGVPCVGFRVGGIPEMIDHQKNGYVARFRDADDLATGINWVLSNTDYAQLSQQAVHQVNMSYSQRSVASRYIEVYNQAMAYKHYKI